MFESLRRSDELWVMRHTQSLEDVDHAVHGVMRNEDIPLSQEGVAHAMALGRSISARLRSRFGEVFKIFVSPSKRAIQTAEIIRDEIVSARSDITVDIVIDELLRKQDTGSLSILNHEEIDSARHEAGVLDYRYPEGENGWDVLERLVTFLGKRMLERAQDKRVNEKTLIITHGFEARLLDLAFLILMKVIGEAQRREALIPKPEHGETRRYKRRGSSYRFADRMTASRPLNDNAPLKKKKAA